MFEGCVEFAREMLSREGAFYPFGETADMKGTRTSVGGYNGQDHPAAQEIYDLLNGAFRAAAQAGEIAAAALAVDVNIPPEYEPTYPDGIRVLLEAPGYSRFLYTPYRIGPQTWFERLLRRRRHIVLAEPFAVQIPPQLIWPVA